MNTIGNFSSYPRDAATFGNVQISQSARAALEARAAAEISLVTSDGDRVTLSASSALAATYSTYDYFGRIGGQTVSGQSENLQIAGSGAFSLNVEGELDPEELADIHKLLQALETASADVFSASGARLSESLANFGSLDSIASFAATLSYSRTVSAEQTTSVASAGETGSDGGAEPAPAVSSSDSKNIRPLLNGLAQLARRLEHEDRLDKMPKRFMQLLKKLAHDPAFGDHEPKPA